jgi:hypothetical protein
MVSGYSLSFFPDCPAFCVGVSHLSFRGVRNFRSLLILGGNTNPDGNALGILTGLHFLVLHFTTLGKDCSDSLFILCSLVKKRARTFDLCPRGSPSPLTRDRMKRGYQRNLAQNNTVATSIVSINFVESLDAHFGHGWQSADQLEVAAETFSGKSVGCRVFDHKNRRVIVSGTSGERKRNNACGIR